MSNTTLPTAGTYSTETMTHLAT